MSDTMTDTERIDKLEELASADRIDTMTGKDFVFWSISFRAPVEATTLREAIDQIIAEESDERP